MISCVVFIVLMLIAIAKCIFYIIYQKSDKRIFSPCSYCEIDSFTFSLYYKHKKIDSCIMYYKYRGYYYIVGANNIYKMGRFKCVVIDEENTNKSEKRIIERLKRDAKTKILKSGELWNDYYLRYVYSNGQSL